VNRLIIFDLDGVLIDSKSFHYQALNLALAKIDSKYIISEYDQKNIYEGLPTKHKLNLLTSKMGLPEHTHSLIWQEKQRITIDLIKGMQKDNDLYYLISKIKSCGIKVAVASNSILETVVESLKAIGIYELIDFIVSNEDVQNTKPHPEMYWKAMSYFKTTPKFTVIFEDSVVGKIAANDSGASLIKIKNRNDLDLNKIDKAIEMLQSASSIMSDESLNVLIPMAGLGKRFSEAGYEFPKPLIDVNNKTMIQAVVESLSIKANYIYLVQKEHYEKYSLNTILNTITPGCKIVLVDGITEGAAVTCLIAKDLINNDNQLLIANSDQIVDWDSREFLYTLQDKNADGGIATFKSNHPKWSYAKTNDLGIVLEVAEKNPISDNATVGIYYWKKGSDFVKYAEQMIDKNIRTNNEFYVCPVFNEAISDNKLIYTIEINKMWGVGTPEDLKNYLYNKSNNV
jgi:HAD superfamily hydrolase (TIGR01509 family)